jgi:hypothetical protein
LQEHVSALPYLHPLLLLPLLQDSQLLLLLLLLLDLQPIQA